MRNIIKKAAVYIAVIAVMLFILPVTVKAAQAGDFMVEGGSSDDYEYVNGVLYIKTGTALTIKNVDGVITTNNRIEVEDGVSANITLAGVYIDVFFIEDVAAFKIADNSVGNVTITLADGTTNVLKSGKNCAGLQKKSESNTGKLVINGDTLGTGVLIAKGGENGAGIGGGNNETSAYIRINGGIVTAQGGKDGAGIGGGNNKDGLEIQICGGSVKAVAGDGAKDIGFGGNLDIMEEYRPTDAAVFYVYLLTINNPEDKDVKIDGNLYVPKNHKAAEQSDGNLYAYLIGETHVVRVGDSETIYIFDDATQTFKTGDLVINGDDEPLIYGTDFTYFSGILEIKTDKAVTIKNADGVATTDEHIRVKADVSANITLAGVNIDMSSNNESAFRIEDNSTGNVTITLKDGTTNVLIGGNTRAGLQKLSAAEVGMLTIMGDTLGTGSLYVEGGENGAGIGGGGGFGSIVANITIKGGSVTAKGGENGAGIGGCNGCEGMNIRIIGGSVKVYPGNNANAIGGGASKAAVTPTNGTAAVYHIFINNPYDKDVYIDGELYVPKNHKVVEATGADGALHAYLTGETHVVRVGDSETVYVFDSALQGFKKPDLVIAGGVEALTYGTDYTYENGILTIKSIKAVTIKNADTEMPTTNRIEVADGVAADITFAGVNIDVSSIDNAAAFKIADNSAGNVTITLADGTTNVLKSGKDCAGLQKVSITSNGMLTINGDTRGTGFLLAEGGEGGAGIGDGREGTTANITIESGTVTAKGGEGGAGIGGCLGGDGTNIRIKGGSVKVIAGSNANAIGGGADRPAATPSNGTANVYLLIVSNPEDKDVYIDGELYTPKNHKAAEPADGNLYVYLTDEAHTVKVGDTIKKYDFDNTVKTFVEIGTDFIVSTIKGFYFVYGKNYTYPKDSGVLTINASTPIIIKNAEGVKTTNNRIVVKAGVSANVIFDGVNIDVSDIANTPAFMIENYSDGNVNITLEDGTTNVLKSGSGCAGLQKISNVDDGMLTIRGERFGTGSLYAEGGEHGAGIGAGSSGAACNITIKSGIVTAKGGKYGAGIGGAYNSQGVNIEIRGGSVKAIAGTDANAIGGGKDRPAATPTNETAEVYLLTVSNPDDKNVYIDGELYRLKNHKEAEPADGNLYVYVTGVPHTVKLGENGKTEMYVLNGSVFEKAQLVITGDDDTLIYGTDYSYADSILTILSGKAVTIKNADGVTTGTDRIEVADGVSAKITLAGANIDVSSIDDTPAFKIADDSTGNVTITLAAGTTNSLRSGKRSAGLQKNGDYISETQGRLTITGEGSLTAYSAGGGAGIGASSLKNSSNITISGGAINAQCGSRGGAGIGGGAANDGVGHGSHITISGGTVTAIGGEYGAGIGGGGVEMMHGGNGSDILIIGGSVKAVAGANANAIGGGRGKAAATPTNGTKNVYPLTITNTGGAAVLIDGSNYLPINHSAADASDKNLYVYLTAEAHTIRVGDTIKRYDFDNTANTFVEIGADLMISATNADETLIYGTDYTYQKDLGQLAIRSNKVVTIKNADGVTTTTDVIYVANSATEAQITLAGVNIDVSGVEDQAAFYISYERERVTITLADGTTNVLKSGKNCAGLQKPGSGATTMLTIKGDMLGTGILVAEGGEEGAGIGGGNGAKATNITISGCTVTAKGGKEGAGIGGGNAGEGTNIIIKGGSVKAVAGSSANAIGGGAGKAAVIPTNGTENVYLKIIENTDAEEIKINGTTYQASHNGETRIYAYLPAKTVADPNKVTVGTVTTKWCYAESQTKWIEVVDIPDADTTVFTYSGREQTYNIVENGCYSISGNKQTNADDYTVTVTLNADTIWSDGTTDSKPYLFKISKAEPVISITLVPASATAGNTIAVSAVAKNPYNDAVADIPDVEISYKIGTGKVTALTKGSFVIPSDTADDTRIIITAVTAESSNYTAGNTEITIRCINEAEYTNDILLNGKACDWPSAVLELSKLPAGSAVTIELDGDYEIPAEVIKKIADNEIKATFILKDWAGWYIDGADITAFIDENLSIFQVFSSGTSLLRGTAGVMFRIAGVKNPATLMISVGKEYAGKFANLYKTDGGKPVFVDNVRVDEDGCVWLDDITESGNYVIMLSDYSDRSGDADNDGRLTALDAAEILRHIVGINAAANSEMIDYNGDGKANALDASQILRDIVYGKN